MAIEQIPTLQLEELVRRWISESKTVSIVVVGKTGAGKSTLINSIVGQYVMGEGRRLKAKTNDVEECCKNINGVDVTLWDTPGLRDPLVVTDTEATLQKIAEKCKKIDLVLCCIPMDSRRMTQDDVDVLVKFTKAFGQGMWRNAIIGLTFANHVTPPPASSDDLRTHFVQKLSEWKEVVSQVLQDKCGLSSEMVRNVPVVPAGHREVTLPDREDWLTVLWVSAFEKMKSESKPAMLKINHQRLRQADIQLDSQVMEPYERAISVNSFDLTNVLKEASATLCQSMESWSTLGTSVSATAATLMNFLGLEAHAVEIVASLGAPVGTGFGVAIAVASVLYREFSQWYARQT